MTASSGLIIAEARAADSMIIEVGVIVEEVGVTVEVGVVVAVVVRDVVLRAYGLLRDDAGMDTVRCRCAGAGCERPCC